MQCFIIEMHFHLMMTQWQHPAAAAPRFNEAIMKTTIACIQQIVDTTPCCFFVFVWISNVFFLHILQRIWPDANVCGRNTVFLGRQCPFKLRQHCNLYIRGFFILVSCMHFLHVLPRQSTLLPFHIKAQCTVPSHDWMYNVDYKQGRLFLNS